VQLSELISSLTVKTGALHTLENGRPVHRSYSSLYQDVRAAQSRLSDWGVTQGTRVGLYAPNSYHWVVYDLALVALGAISMPFTDDFSGAIDASLIERYRLGMLLISRSHAPLFPDRPRYVALIDADNEDARVLERNESRDPDEEDQLSLVFSSGSAGGLKGLVISRRGVVSTLPPTMDAVGVRRGDRLLLFLPLSNFQQRFLCYAAFWYDFDIILTEPTHLFMAIDRLSPTILLAPPVFYQMIYAEFMRFAPWKRGLRLVLGSLIGAVAGPTLRRKFARCLFPDFYRQFGDSMRTLITGMAPIRRDIQSFFKRMQLPLSEAYGMVEAGVMAFRPGESTNYASVGAPLRGVSLHIEDDGEIVVTREHPLTLRYFQCAEGENERTFISPNRIATGDVGKVDGRGNLYLRGRKKEIIVAPSGVKVHPETIEEELNRCPDVANSIVFMKPDRSHLTCVVVLNQLEDTAAQQRVRSFAMNLKTTKKLAMPVEVAFCNVNFSKENGLLRPNMKIDRKRIAALFGGPS
jgi:long-chain acyl-CoA synthetase